MRRKLSMIFALSVTLTMLTACGNIDNIDQAELDNDLLITQSSVSEISAASETEPAEHEEIISATSETTSAEHKEYIDIEMPAPFENEGGDLNSDFYSTVDAKLGYIDMSFVNMVGVEEFESWLNSTSSSKSDLTAVGEFADLYSFIKHFGISDDVVRENLLNMRNGSADDFSDEEIDLLLSDNDEAVAQHFVSDTAIIKGSDIYSLKWVYYHSPEDYAAAGITATELKTALTMFDDLTLTDEAAQAIEMKINSYTSDPASD